MLNDLRSVPLTFLAAGFRVAPPLSLAGLSAAVRAMAAQFMGCWREEGVCWAPPLGCCCCEAAAGSEGVRCSSGSGSGSNRASSCRRQEAVRCSPRNLRAQSTCTAVLLGSKELRSKNKSQGVQSRLYV